MTALSRSFRANARIIVPLAIGAAGIFAFAAFALAGTGLSVTPNFPSSVTVGQTAVPVSLVIGNASTADEGTVTMSSITLVPSCGNSVAGCTSPDPDVFAVSAAGTGKVGTSCAGDAFTIAETNPTTGEVTFTRTGGPLTLAFGASCEIEFTVDVLKSPTIDATGAAGIQTAQLGAANGTSALQNPASGTGADFTTVVKAAPSISTTPNPTTGSVGTTLNDTATLTGGFSPTGSTTFKLFPPSDPTCAGAASYTDTDGAAPYATSPGFVANASGVWHWTADYLGDANNVATSSGCVAEPVTISKNSPTISTTLVPASPVNVGTAVHDTAALSGATANAGGSVTYTVYTDNACSAGAQSAGTKTVTNGAVPDSDPITFNSAGTFNWQAVYSGDAGNNAATSTCQTETLVVNSFTSTTTTAIHFANHSLVNISAVPAGSTVHDSATVTGSGPTPTGTTSFTFFSGGGADICDAQTASAGTVALVAGVSDPSDAQGPLSAGTYAFRAIYSGDSNYPGGSTSVCEPFTVVKNQPTLATTPNPASGEVGAVLNDSATLSGAYNPTGSITFNLYSPADPTCSGAAAYTQTVPLTGNSASTSPGFASNAAGTWHWTADYPGDVNNEAAHSACSAEPVTITQPAGEYCSPGYWKQSQHFDSWVGYNPSQTFSSVFGKTITINWSAKGKPQPLTNPTLLQALQANGGGINLIAREAVDALLNAASLNFGFTTAQVIAAVQQAIDQNNPSLLNQFNLAESCPLN